MNIYIITPQVDQMPETLFVKIFTEGLKALFVHAGKYKVATISFREVKAVMEEHDALLLFLWTKEEGPRIMDRIHTLRTAGDVQQPILIVINRDGIANREVKQLIAYGKICIVSSCISGHELYNYIEKLYEGNRTWILSNDLQTALLDQLFTDFQDLDNTEKLSGREQQILELAQRGYSIEQTAEVLLLSPSTVATYRRRAMKKARVGSMKELLTKTVNS